MKILLGLRTAFNVKGSSRVYSGEERIKQYVDGFNSFFYFEKNLKNSNHNIDIFLIDNTVSNMSEIDDRILNTLKDRVQFILFDDNKFGSVNKGAGLIDAWNKIKDKILEYDFVLHHEPRMILSGFSFFDSFLNNPRNLFTENGNDKNKHFNTGLFGIESKTLIDFSKNIDLINMIHEQESIENLLYDFFKNNKIVYESADKLGVIWIDAFSNQKYII